MMIPQLRFIRGFQKLGLNLTDAWPLSAHRGGKGVRGFGVLGFRDARVSRNLGFLRDPGDM